MIDKTLRELELELEVEKLKHENYNLRWSMGSHSEILQECLEVTVPVPAPVTIDFTLAGTVGLKDIEDMIQVYGRGITHDGARLELSQYISHSMIEKIDDPRYLIDSLMHKFQAQLLHTMKRKRGE